MSKTQFKGKDIEVTVEDAKSHIINYARNLNATSERRYGYDIYLSMVIQDYQKKVLKFSDHEVGDSNQVMTHISPAFIDAAWELCNLRVLRPGTRDTSGHGTTTPGYSITEFGYTWIAESHKEEYTPVESERFAFIMEQFTTYFGTAFQERAQEAIRCYNSHAYLASCIMSGSAAETILIFTSEHLGNKVKTNDKPETLCKQIINKSKELNINTDGVSDRLLVYRELIKYWRDAGMHHKQWKIDYSTANFSLSLLMQMAFYIKNKWFV